MSAIVLPTTPGHVQTTITRISEGIAQRGSFGGVTRYFERLGSGRHRMAVMLPPQEFGDAAAAWHGKLSQAMAGERIVRMGVRQLNPNFTSITGTLINGASQVGQTMAVDTATPSTAVVKSGRYLSIVVSSISYLFENTTDVTLVAGAGTLNLDGLLLRCSPGDNLAVELNSPIIEGYLSGDADSWTLDTIVHQGIAFSIEEAA